jgi:type VI secretion system protein ImpL
MFKFLKSRALLTILGFLLLGLFIWFAGPYFEFADYRPLESAVARLIAFAFVFLVWLALRLLRQLRAYRASDRLAAAVVQQAAVDKERPSAEATQLRERFEEAVATLKQTRRSGHSLYDLPWYVIIGAPGSGKTTALLNSGLKFPLEQRVGKGALRGVGGTRNCDWWFTDEAIFLDTAGRFTTQDSDATADSAGWSAFLGLLRKYRKRRPLNGVILTISAQDLMTQGDRARDAHVEAARRRLNELNKELNIQLPVYVMVTKCDLVAGFSEYFDDLAQDGRAQVWGVTFPYEQTLHGEVTQAYPSEFDQLMERLNSRVYSRIDEDRDVRRRTRVLAFPQQMAALRDPLAQFIAEVFGSTRLEQQVLLRGVYFTSGTQEGTPIDRLLGALGRRFGVAPDVVAPTGRGKAYFVERLLRDVLIGESGLAGVNRRLEVQKAAWQLGSYAAMATIAVLGVIALSVSYNRNRTYVAETQAALAKVAEAPPVAPTALPEALLPRLDAIRAVVTAADRYRERPPLGMRWGLFQGGSIGNAARDAYVRELDGVLLPRIAARFEKRLSEYAPEPEKLFEYLKAYLMLGEPKRLDRKHLQFVADLEWHAADTTVPHAGTSLSQHFQSLLDYSDGLRPMALNASLIAQARSTLRQASFPRIVFNRLQRTYVNDSARAVRLDLAGGVGADKVLRRKNGKSLSDPVPSFYSRPVFQEIAGTQIGDLVKQFSGDDWVWGEGGGFSGGANRLAMDVTGLYERDYIATWEDVLDNLELVPFTSTAQAIESLGILAAPGSPLRGVLAAVVDNTSLVQAPAAKEPTVADAAKKSLSDRLGGEAIKESLGGLFGQTKDGKPTLLPGALVTAHFQPVHRLLAGEQGNTPIDRVLVRIGQIQHQLRAVGPGQRGVNPIDGLSDPGIRDILQSLQDETDALPPIIQDLIGQIGRKAEVTVVAGASSELERRYRTEVLQECNHLLAGRYPFTPGSAVDLPIGDFAKLFGIGGVFDDFFKANLESVVDRSQTPWTWVSGAARGPRAILDQFEAAQQIRDLFVRRGSGALEVRFHVTVAEVGGSSIAFDLELHGQRIEYRPPPRAVLTTWPGPNLAPGAALQWNEKFGAKPRQTFPGPWALFRLLDAGQEKRESDVLSSYTFQMPGQMPGHSARIVLDAANVLNPFSNRSWQRFRCEF